MEALGPYRGALGLDLIPWVLGTNSLSFQGVNLLWLLERSGPTHSQALKAPLGTSPVPSLWELPEKAGKSLLASGWGVSCQRP